MGLSSPGRYVAVGTVPTTESYTHDITTFCSWITPSVAAKCKTILANGSRNKARFSKFGDSMSATPLYLADLDVGGAAVNLSTWASEVSAGVTAFAGSWGRTSLAATNGWTSTDLIGAYATEITAWTPAVALLKIGTNDITGFGAPGVTTVMTNVTTMVAALIAGGTIPVLESIPNLTHFGGSFETNAESLNTQLQALAESNRIPWLDTWGYLQPQASFGLGSDDIHPGTYVDPLGTGNRSCWFTSAALDVTQRTGQNRRNILTLRMLSHLKAIVFDA